MPYPADCTEYRPQSLVGLLQPFAGGKHARMVRKMAQGFLRQVMTFVKNINGVFRLGQYGTATEGQIRQYQIVVGDNAIDAVNGIACFKKTATGDIGATPPCALAMVGGNHSPLVVFQRSGPGVALAVPFVGSQR